MAERIVVVGGSRSGKSAVAEQLVEPAGGVTYVATAAVADDEMAARVTAHRARRPAAWHTVETTDLAAAIREAPAGAVLIDALATWLVERIGAHGLWPDDDAVTAPLDEAAAARAEGLLAELDHAWAAAAAHEGGPVVIVAEEVGAGVVPAEAGVRRFVDLAGWATQRVAGAADRVLWVVAGRALDLPPRAGPTSEPSHRTATAAGERAARARGTTASTEPGVAGGLIPATESTPAALRDHGDEMVPEGALNLAVNVVPGGPPLHIAGQLRAAAADVSDYPDDAAARQALAARHRLDPGAVLPTAGATDALWTLAAALGPAHAVVLHPQFTEGEAALRACGWAVSHVYRDPERDWMLEPDAVPDDAELVLVGNPVNPLGRLDDPAAVAALCRPGRLVVVDEAFVDFVAEEAGASLAGRVADAGIAVLRTPTKLWGLPGVRAGALLAAPELVDHLRAHRRPWAVGEVGLAALRACSDDDEYRRRVAGEVVAERERLRRRLTGLAGVELAAEPAANFACLRVPDGDTIHQRLLAQAVAVRRSTFPGLSSDHLRVAVHDAAATDRLVSALAHALGQPTPADADRPSAEQQEPR